MGGLNSAVTKFSKIGEGGMGEVYLAQGTARQLTRFTGERIFGYAPSPDGKQFAVVRAAATADIISIKDFR